MTEGGEDKRSAAIADLSVSGNYATDDTPIETAVNSIILALEKAGIIVDN